MSYYRSYFSKNNTLLENSSINTAKNPNTEIFYGTISSRYIFGIDVTELRGKLDTGDLVLDDNTKHYLHLTNTIFGDENFIGQENGKGRDRATSFDLVIFTVTDDWSEGVGFDYNYSPGGNASYDQRPSNWYYRTTENKWTFPGTYFAIEESTSGLTITGTTIIKTITFDNGNEDIHADISSYINDVLTGSSNNIISLGVGFHPYYEKIGNSTDQSVAFFSKYTQTFFEPYLETQFDDQISDSRNSFYAGRINNLYLYVTKGSNFFDLDELPTVDILGNNNVPISGLTGLVTTKVRKGVYKVSFGINGTLCDGKKFFYDKWCNLVIDGVSLNCVTQKFIPKSIMDGYTIGENQTELERYVIQFFGVKLNEKIKRGDVRKIVVTLRSINQQKPILWDDIYYRIYIEEGLTQVNVFEWTKLDKTNENSFYLNTSYMIPREYHIEIMTKTHTEEIFYRESINFEIVSEKIFSKTAIESTPRITSTPIPSVTPSVTPSVPPPSVTLTPTPTPTPSTTNLVDYSIQAEDGQFLFTEDGLIISL